jgi:hypothetical protein
MTSWMISPMTLALSSLLVNRKSFVLSMNSSSSCVVLPGMISAWTEVDFPGVCRKEILIGKRVHNADSTGNEISVMAWRTELLPVF